ncbi:cerebral cavernous malformations protein 2 homolog isoform X2 [Mizuhopecten yessoensis]|uniref:cerebral cavernous malformations protein 2 homolog isoform X2 n=1 Tax=Mizuhopecten yessoensis TaxID=6573 RepID=UPI000B459EE7|nr:cerebral cavernous malformations protein 2 homolog isoform X2 [Mizuhopecten yessoensis]
MDTGDWFPMDEKSDRFGPGARPREIRSSLQDPSRRAASQSINPPDYPTSSAVFTQNDYKEFVVRFAGVIPGVPMEVDVTNRTEVLRIIDSGKKQGRIPLQAKFEVEVILSLSKSNIKLLKKAGNEVILRLPIHEIAAICYIQDDRVHILSIKHGNPDNCDLAVMYCANQGQAQDICALVEKCFQMVYIEFTIQLLEQAIEVKSVHSTDSTITSSTSERPSFMSTSQDQIYSPNSKDPMARSKSESGNSDTSSRTKLVNVYMEELPNQFNLEELTTFASLLKTLNDSSSHMPFPEFCDQVFKLYGPKRKNLLGGLSPFIPESEYRYFADFLKKHDLKEPEDGTLSSRNSFPGNFRRSVSDVSGDGSHIDDILDKISTQFQKIDASMGTVSDSYLK